MRRHIGPDFSKNSISSMSSTTGNIWRKISNKKIMTRATQDKNKVKHEKNRYSNRNYVSGVRKITSIKVSVTHSLYSQKASRFAFSWLIQSFHVAIYCLKILKFESTCTTKIITQQSTFSLSESLLERTKNLGKKSWKKTKDVELV